MAAHACRTHMLTALHPRGLPDVAAPAPLRIAGERVNLRANT